MGEITHLSYPVGNFVYILL